MMTPRDYYRKLSHEITDVEVKAVALIMSDHIGEDDAIRLEDLCELTNNSCHYPPDETGEIKPVQPALLDVPEPDIIPYWRW